MPTGLVMRSTGSRHLVRGEDGTLHDCVARGNLRIKGWRSTNPVAVGDHVDFEPGSSGKPGSITGLHDRRNYLVRRSVNLSHQRHVLAANVDQALLIVTVARPRTSFGFIDRFLVTAEIYRVPVIIVLNKVDDLRTEEELGSLAEYQDVYEGAGYRTVIASALKGDGVDEVAALLHGKVTLVAGHSGVGKSTLVNAIDPSLDLHTTEISRASEKGQHTTTYAEMFELRTANDGVVTPTKEGFIIDTPGIKGFGLVDMQAEDIGDQFPEMFRLKGGCRFNNCSHRDEPGCAVREAVEQGDVAGSRYRSYLDMLAGIGDESPYRQD